MANRRQFLKRTGALGTIGLAAGCLGGDGGQGDGETTTANNATGENGETTTADGETTTTTTSGGTTTTSQQQETVRFVLTPAESDVNVKKQYAGVFSYLEEETGVTIEPQVAGDYTAVFQALKNDQAEIADASPTLAVVGGQEGVTEVVGIRVAFGAAKYFATITTTPDSGVESLTDLEGKKVAFADRLSTSGSLFPLYMLKQAGLDIGDAPQGSPAAFEGVWSDHSTAVNELINRQDIAAAGTGAFVSLPHVPKDQLPDQVAEISAEADGAGSEDPPLDLVKASDPIPRAPILSRADWDSSARQDIETALIEATEEDFKGSEADEGIWFTGVQEGSVDDYEPVRNVKEALGLQFGN